MTLNFILYHTLKRNVLLTWWREREVEGYERIHTHKHHIDTLTHHTDTHIPLMRIPHRHTHNTSHIAHHTHTTYTLHAHTTRTPNRHTHTDIYI